MKRLFILVVLLAALVTGCKSADLKVLEKNLLSLDVSIVSTFANSKSNSSFKEDNVLESIISFAKYLPFVINLSVLTRLLLL